MIEITEQEGGKKATFSNPDGTHVVHMSNPTVVEAVRELLEEHKRLKAVVHDLRRGSMADSEQRPDMHQIIEHSHTK